MRKHLILSYALLVVAFLVGLVSPAFPQTTFTVESSGRGLQNAKMGARMEQLHGAQQDVIDKLQPQAFSTLPNCASTGSKISWSAVTETFSCTQEADPTVEAFAKQTLPSCGVNEFLTGNGASLSCLDATSAVTGAEIDPTVAEFAKDALPQCSNNQALTGRDGAFLCTTLAGEGVETDPTVQEFAKLALPNCGVGQVLKATGNSLSCVSDTIGSFTESDPMTMSFAKRTLPVCAENQVLSTTDGMGLSLSCIDAAIAAAEAADNLGDHTATQALDMANFGIEGLKEPTNAQDAATKAYVDAEVASGVASVSETDPTVEEFAKAVLPTCAADQLLSGDGASLTCVDAATAAAGAADNLGDHTATQALDMASSRIIGMDDPVNAQDAATKAYVDAEVAAGVASVSETDPTVAEFAKAVLPTCAADQLLSGDGANLTCVDAATAASGAADNLGDHTATQALDMASSRIIGMDDPVNAQDAATKAYVDAEVASGVASVSETDPTVEEFAKAVLPTCAADQLLSGDGASLTCVDAATAASGAADNLGDHTATQALDMASSRIIGMDDPVNAQDAATKAYVDAEVAAGVASVSETDPTVEEFAKSVLPTCTSDQLLSGDGANLTCVDAATAAAGASDNLGDHKATQDLDLATFAITALKDPINAQDAATKNYVDEALLSGAGNSGTIDGLNSTQFVRSDVSDTIVGPIGVNVAPANDALVDIKGGVRVRSGFGMSIGHNFPPPASGIDLLGDLKFRENATVYTGGANTINIGDGNDTVQIKGTHVFGTKVGISTLSPSSSLHVLGDLQLSSEGVACDAVKEGAIRYNAGIIELCDGSAWQDIASSGADNLGDHIATQDIELSGHALTINGTMFLGEGTGVSTTVLGLDALAGGADSTVVGKSAGTSSTAAINQSAFGARAGLDNTGPHQSAFGVGAGNKNTGSLQSVFGLSSGYQNSGSSQSAFGVGSGSQNAGYGQTAFGFWAGSLNTGTLNISVGPYAGRANTGDNVVAIGYRAGENNTRPNQFILKQNGVGSGPLIQGDFGTGHVGLGTEFPSSTLHVIGNLQLGGTVVTCDAAREGSLHYASGSLEFCDGSAWLPMGSVNEINDLADARYVGQSVYLGENSGVSDPGSTDRFNVGTGVLSLNANTTGRNNVGVGYKALWKNNGNFNVAVGYGALQSNIGAAVNTAVGTDSLRSNTSGYGNSGFGRSALSSNTTGGDNTASGIDALYSNTTGSKNTGVGSGALAGNQSGASNLALGNDAGRYLESGSVNSSLNQSVFIGAETRAKSFSNTNSTVIGFGAIGAGSNSVVLGNDSVTKTLLKGKVGVAGITSPFSSLHVGGDIQLGSEGVACEANKAGAIRYISGNIELCNGTSWGAVGGGTVNEINDLADARYVGQSVYLGENSGVSDPGSTDRFNVGTGVLSLNANTTGRNNVGVGYKALWKNNGNFNVAIGHEALQSNTTGPANTALGSGALRMHTTGFSNTAVGRYAMANTSTGYQNTSLGSDALYANTSCHVP